MNEKIITLYNLIINKFESIYELIDLFKVDLLKIFNNDFDTDLINNIDKNKFIESISYIKKK